MRDAAPPEEADKNTELEERVRQLIMMVINWGCHASVVSKKCSRELFLQKFSRTPPTPTAVADFQGAHTTSPICPSIAHPRTHASTDLAAKDLPKRMMQRQ